ncbi:MAG: hypothetical protein ABJD97_02985 [Betaproteobacteria bacterium]
MPRSAAPFALLQARLAQAALPLLLMLAFVQGLLGCWAQFGAIAGPIVPPGALTDIGKSLYRPDRDMALYVAGTLASVGLYAAIDWRLGRARGRTAAAPRHLDTLVALAALAAVALLPFVVPTPALGHLLACALGWVVVGWRRAAWRAAPCDATTPVAPRATFARRLAALLTDSAIPVVVVALLVFVPWPQAILWRAYAHDNFHHFDFYAVAPALAWAHGQRLATDFYAQYGVGWPLVVAWLARATGALNHTQFIRLELAVGCAYFLVLFLFLRAWLRDVRWAIAGMLLALFVGLFLNNEEGFKWLWPSSTPMRYVFDVAFFAALLAHARSGAARLGLLVGGVMGLQLLFATDVGLYMLLAFGVYVVCASRRPHPASAPWATGRFALGAALSLVLVTLVGFTLANQGTPPDGAFWAGWSESLRAYGGGLTHLPIAGELGQSAIVDVLLPAMLLAYFLGAGSALSACARRAVAADQALTATIAVYGMGTLVLFIGRSHHYNLLHVAIPACLLFAKAAHGLLHDIGTRRLHRLAVPVVACVALAWLLLDETIATDYPDAIDVALGIVQVKPAKPEWTRPSGDVVEPIFPRKTVPFRLACDAIRRASAGGRQSVAVIGLEDTPYLMEAGVAPWFRYSPVLANLVSWSQVEALEQRIEQAPPHWIFLASEPEPTLYNTTTADVLAHITAFVRQRYELREHAGPFAVYEQAAAPPPPRLRARNDAE